MAKRAMLIVAILGVLTAGSTALASQLKPGEKRALEVKPAVALVAVQFHTRWIISGLSVELRTGYTSFGTGFFFNPDGYLITNGHVVEPARANYLPVGEFLSGLKTVIRLIEKETGKEVTVGDVLNARLEVVPPVTLTVALTNGKKVSAEILEYSAPMAEGGKDIAVLKVPGSNYPTVSLGNSDQVHQQDSVMVVGYPAVASRWGDNPYVSAESNYQSSATNGHISALKTDSNGDSLLQTDAPIAHGNSGGPAFNDDGQVVGIATLGSETQGFNFLIPINTAMEFVRESGAQPASGSFDTHWNRALDLYDAGQFRQAINEFDDVLQFMPDFPDAKRMRAAAVIGEDSLTPVQKVVERTGTTLLYGIAIVLLASILIFSLRKSRPSLAHERSASKAVAQESRAVRPGATVHEGDGGVPHVGSVDFGTLQFISGPLSGRSFKIGKDGLWIGRDPRCGAVLPDDIVSGQHAWVVPVDGSVMVIDKGSSNGTYLNSVESPRISKVGLKNGDRIFFGKKGPVATFFMN